MQNGTIYHIDFSGNKGFEINSIHLGVIFTIPNISNMVFCIPLTSPKIKHFKNKTAFEERNHNEIKHQNYVYIKQTDSIALLDQIRSISTYRLLNQYNKNTTLNDDTIKLLIIKLNKYIKNILKK